MRTVSCSYGQVGDGSTTDRYTPVQVRTSATPTYLSGVAQITAGDYHTCVRFSTGGTYGCWGYNSLYQLGDGTTTNGLFAPAPRTITSFTITWIAAGEAFTCTTSGDTSNQCYCWVRNRYVCLCYHGVPKFLTHLKEYYV
jgi:alpha-tubulin suppressor-like RCC1 family protein